LSPNQSIATPELFWDHYIGDWQLQSSSNFNTDEHPRVEFLTPISNRDGKMILGKNLERYYEEVFLKLPTNGAGLSGDQDGVRRRDRQRMILFGE
jgi:spermidine synthase